MSFTAGRKTADGLRIEIFESEEDEEDADSDERGVEHESSDSSSRSRGRVLGYVARSSCGANCAGLTKMERTVRSFPASECLTANTEGTQHYIPYS